MMDMWPVVECPHCGVSHYIVENRISTQAYYPPIIKNGFNINPDRNKTLFVCRCMKCSTEFSYTTMENKLIDGTVSQAVV